MKIRSHTAECKLLVFSAVTANMLELDLFEEVRVFAVWLGRFAPFAKYQHRGMAIWHVAPLRSCI